MLKLLACLFMLIDHIGYYFYPFLPDWLASLMRLVGRLAFPMFAWGVALGYTRTRNPVVYFFRMAFFAAVSEALIRISHQAAGLYWPGTNVMVTFALAIAMISGFRLAVYAFFDVVGHLKPIAPDGHTGNQGDFGVRLNPRGISLNPYLGIPLGLLMMLAAAFAALALKPDYGLYGLLAVTGFFALREFSPDADRLKRSMQFFIVLNALFLIIRVFSEQMPLDWAILQTFSIAALPLCNRYEKGKKPGSLTKYVFYLFYPGHLVLFALIRAILG